MGETETQHNASQAAPSRASGQVNQNVSPANSTQTAINQAQQKTPTSTPTPIPANNAHTANTAPAAANKVTKTNVSPVNLAEPAKTTAMPQAPIQQPPAPKTATLPVAVPASEYHPVAGGVNPATPGGGKPKKKRSALLIVGIIVCLLAAAVLGATLFYILNKPAEQLDVQQPQMAMVQSEFDSSNIQPAGIAAYAYIDDSFDNPEISDISIGNVNYNNDRTQATCTATAKALFENESVSVEENVEMPFTYNTSTKQWDAGRANAKSDNIKVTPVGPPDIEKLQVAIPDLLREYDPNIGSVFENADIVADGDLDENGGEITFNLDKLNSNDTHTQTSVNVGVVWDSKQGWVPTINWVGEITGEMPESTEQPNGEGGNGNENAQTPSSSSAGTNAGNNNGGNNGPSMVLNCATGDLVEIPGVIEYRDNHVLLRSDYMIRVYLDGVEYTCNYFELTANQYVVTVGAHVAAVGEISATGTLPQAPLMINMDF